MFTLFENTLLFSAITIIINTEFKAKVSATAFVD